MPQVHLWHKYPPFMACLNIHDLPLKILIWLNSWYRRRKPQHSPRPWKSIRRCKTSIGQHGCLILVLYLLAKPIKKITWWVPWLLLYQELLHSLICQPLSTMESYINTCQLYALKCRGVVPVQLLLFPSYGWLDHCCWWAKYLSIFYSIGLCFFKVLLKFSSFADLKWQWKDDWLIFLLVSFAI